jgi:hypothetical protein
MRAPRTRVAVMSDDDVFARGVVDALSSRPVEVECFTGAPQLRTLSRQRWRELLVVIIDVDTSGAWQFVRDEDSIQGLLFETPLVVASREPITHPWDDDEHGEPPPWCGTLLKPPPFPTLLRVIDRELAFEGFAPPLSTLYGFR